MKFMSFPDEQSVIKHYYSEIFDCSRIWERSIINHKLQLHPKKAPFKGWFTQKWKIFIIYSPHAILYDIFLSVKQIFFSSKGVSVVLDTTGFHCK